MVVGHHRFGRVKWDGSDGKYWSPVYNLSGLHPSGNQENARWHQEDVTSASVPGHVER